MNRSAVACLACGTIFERPVMKDPRRTKKFCTHACSTVFNRRSPSDRFWEKVEKTEGCWVFHGGRNKKGRKGYGVFGLRVGKIVYAHRFVWEMTHGPIVGKLDVCHHCDNPPCVNPAHLFLGTRSENLQDASRKGRLKKPLKTHCIRGHEFTTENTRLQDGSAWRRCIACERARLRRRVRRQVDSLAA